MPRSVLSYTVYNQELCEGLATSRTSHISSIRYLLTVTDCANPYFSALVQRHEIGRLLDEAMSEDDVRQLQEAEEVCRKFLSTDLTSDEGKREVLAIGVKNMLESILQLGDHIDDELPMSPSTTSQAH
jgi:hypothetical protein